MQAGTKHRLQEGWRSRLYISNHTHRCHYLLHEATGSFYTEESLAPPRGADCLDARAVIAGPGHVELS